MAGIIYGHKRYKKMSDLTGGDIASIKQNFSDTLLRMGDQISQLASQFPLSNQPVDESSLKVFVDDKCCNHSKKTREQAKSIIDRTKIPKQAFLSRVREESKRSRSEFERTERLSVLY